MYLMMRDADPSEDASHIVIIGRLAKLYLRRGEQIKGHDSSPTSWSGRDLNTSFIILYAAIEILGVFEVWIAKERCFIRSETSDIYIMIN